MSNVNEAPVEQTVDAATQAAPVNEQAGIAAPQAPVKQELTLEEQFAKLEAEKQTVVAQLAEIDAVVAALGLPSIDAPGVPAFMKANADSLKKQIESFDARFSALQNKVPMENTKRFLESLAANFASFGFSEAVSFNVSFDPKNNTVTVGTGRAKSTAAPAVKKEGGSTAITSRSTTLNGVPFASGAAALDEAKKILGLPETFGAGNSAVRVLTSLMKQYPDKISVQFGA